MATLRQVADASDLEAGPGKGLTPVEDVPGASSIGKAAGSSSSSGAAASSSKPAEEGDGGKKVKDLPDEDKPASADETWCGPYRVGPLVFELYGPLQGLFVILTLVALVLLIIEVARDDRDPLRIAVAAFLVLTLVYLVWLGKSLYVLKRFQKQITTFKTLNRQLNGQVQELEGQNDEYKKKNEEHSKLNTQLRSEVEDLSAQNDNYIQQNKKHQQLNGELAATADKLKGDVENLTAQGETYKKQNQRHEENIHQLEEQVDDLKHVENQLTLLSQECNGSVQQARGLLERLERNLRLDTVNTVFLFFDRIDKDKSGKLDPSEISLFVDNLSFLWKHLPNFDKEELKAQLIDQGGITMEQCHTLVEGMLAEEDEKAPEKMEERLGRSFGRTQSPTLTDMLKEVEEGAPPAEAPPAEGEEATNPFSADVAPEDKTE
mmetsp:Transcript_127217/g.223941  ORF Transcript_127217/g.223941 Transcript_127217/m.223941 type:complete len:434 (+) Transcript_127217:59-1360(+)